MKTLTSLLFFLLVSFNCHSQKSDTSLILNHLNNIVNTQHFRNAENINALDSTANYIFTEFERYNDNVSFQPYNVFGRTYKNVISSFGPKDAPRIILGAHYDVCGNQPGADDNASGTTALLELNRMFSENEKDLKYRIDLVAYTLEEPPFFRTFQMGSFVHAKSLKDSTVNVLGMISIEMIGYFDDAKKSQEYPLKILSLFYGNKGNYITNVRKFGSGKFARKYNRKSKKLNYIKTKSFQAPKNLEGIDWSDHLNYWRFGYSSLMITDTSFFRNKNYHEVTDTIETLDINRMKAVIDTIFETILGLK